MNRTTSVDRHGQLANKPIEVVTEIGDLRATSVNQRVLPWEKQLSHWHEPSQQRHTHAVFLQPTDRHVVLVQHLGGIETKTILVSHRASQRAERDTRFLVDNVVRERELFPHGRGTCVIVAAGLDRNQRYVLAFVGEDSNVLLPERFSSRKPDQFAGVVIDMILGVQDCENLAAEFLTLREGGLSTRDFLGRPRSNHKARRNCLFGGHFSVLLVN